MGAALRPVMAGIGYRVACPGRRGALAGGVALRVGGVLWSLRALWLNPASWGFRLRLNGHTGRKGRKGIAGWLRPRPGSVDGWGAWFRWCRFAHQRLLGGIPPGWIGGADGDACAARVSSTDESQMRLSKGPGACRQANGWSCEWGAQHGVFPGGPEVPGENVEEPLF